MVADKTMSFQTVPDSFIILGGGAGNGHETPDTLFWINLRTVRFVNGKPTEELVDVSVALSPAQLALIVKRFFGGVIAIEKKNIYANFLRRLLQKRYAVMTAPWVHPSDNGYAALQYTKLD
jgi:hypothetical protein